MRASGANIAVAPILKVSMTWAADAAILNFIRLSRSCPVIFANETLYELNLF